MRKPLFIQHSPKKQRYATIALFLLTLWAQPGRSQENALHFLQQAQKSFLNSDGKALVKNIKEALIQSKNHPLVVRNASDLYQNAESKGLLKDINPGWQVPAELKYLNVSVHRKYMYEGGKVRFFISAGATQTEPEIVEQFQVIQYPNQVVLDKVGKIGDWKEQEWDGKPTFWIGEDWHAEQVPEGLYLINIKIKNQPLVQGWFVINDENSSASPVIKIPKVNQIFTTDQPNFIWKNFRSPEFNREEHTRIGYKISREGTDLYEEITNAQINYQQELSEMQFRVGDKAAANAYQGATYLKPGSYQFSLGFREIHNFGDLLIVRVSSSKVPFSVESKQ
jgi:hypothetical protein